MPFEQKSKQVEQVQVEQTEERVEEQGEESIEWTGFNFIDVYHFCPDAQHVLNHHTIRVPGIGIVYRGTTIYKKDNKYFVKETR